MAGTPRELSFCEHALARGAEVMDVPDMTADPRFREHPLVAGEPNVRAYAGAPVVDGDGRALGTVCVLHLRSRPGPLTAFQHRGLRLLARAAASRLDERVARAREARALEESELRFRTLADAMPQMAWSARADGHVDYLNARWYEFTGRDAGGDDAMGWEPLLHPDDRDRARGAWAASVATGEPYGLEYRLRRGDGAHRWVLARAQAIRGADGRPRRWFGTLTDVHEQREASDEREVMAHELSHRIKNIFAVIAGLVGFAGRARPEFAPAAADLRERITALGRAHDFVRPHSQRSRPDARQDSLHGLLADLFRPYERGGEPLVSVEGPDVPVDDRAATPLALLFHELATNAAKYGALSAEGGRVLLAVEAAGDRVVLRWRERGGPRVAEPDGRAEGFGSRLIELSAVRQLGGAVERDWAADGLEVRVEAPRAAFSRVEG